MASPKNYPNGLNLAGTVFADGPAILQGNTYFSGPIQWVSSTTGNNANAGVLPEFPVASIAQAITNFAAATDGIMVIGKNHAESLTGSQSLALAGLSIFGCGVGSSRPRFTCAGAIDMFAVSGAGTRIEGLYFPASTAVPTDRIGIAAADCTIKDCYFECGANDLNRALRIHTGGNHATVDDCSFVATAQIPATGVEVSAAVTDPTILDCTFDGGSYGWSSYALLVTAAATRIKIINPTLLNRADIGVSVTATSYQLFGVNIGGTGNVRLDA